MNPKTGLLFIWIAVRTKLSKHNTNQTRNKVYKNPCYDAFS